MTLAEQYLPILLLMIISTLFATLPMLLSYLLNKVIDNKDPNKKLIKLSNNKHKIPYECGNDPINNPSSQNNYNFSVIAILFIVFYVEIIFLFTCASEWSNLQLNAKFSIGFFTLMFVIGFFYTWHKGALNIYD